MFSSLVNVEVSGEDHQAQMRFNINVNIIHDGLDEVVLGRYQWRTFFRTWHSNCPRIKLVSLLNKRCRYFQTCNPDI